MKKLALSRKNKSRLKWFLKTAVSLGFLLWVIFKVDWKEAGFYFQQIKVWQILVFVAIYLLGIFISSYKWQVLADFKGFKFSKKFFFETYLTGTFINNFLPSFIGGDAYRAYQSGKASERYSQAASAVLMDRIIGLLAATVLALIFSALNFKNIAGNGILMAINLLLVVSLAFDGILFLAKKSAKLKNFLTQFVPQKIMAFAKEVNHFNHDSKIITKSFWLSALFALEGVALLNYFLFWAMGIRIDFLDYLSVIFIISIVSSLPISINNIGLKEWAYVTFFGFFGASASAVVAAALLSRFLQMAVSFLALPAYLKNK